MSAATMSAATLTAVHRQFEAALPAVDTAARFAFGRRRRQDREDAIAEARAAAWSAWAGLIQKGKDPLEVGVHGIANNACRYVKSGRRLGNTNCGRDAMDVQHSRVRRDLGLRVVSFEEVAGSPCGSWRDWLAEDNRVSPADEACFRLDFEAWLTSLPDKKRRIAELLAEDHETDVVARMVGVSPGRVSQVRNELAASWEKFQDGDAVEHGQGVALIR